MSERYFKEIADAAEWFSERLATLPAFEMTEAGHDRGTDALPQPYKGLVKTLFDTWAEERKYLLSYGQVCSAFFTAAKQTGKLTIIGGGA